MKNKDMFNKEVNLDKREEMLHFRYDTYKCNCESVGSTAVPYVEWLEMFTETEQVYHPNHYNKNGRKECWDEMLEMVGPKILVDWCLLTSYKYLYRNGDKKGNPKNQDREKAVNYFNKAKEVIQEYDVVLDNGLFGTIESLLNK